MDEDDEDFGAWLSWLVVDVDDWDGWCCFMLFSWVSNDQWSIMHECLMVNGLMNDWMISVVVFMVDHWLIMGLVDGFRA